MLASMLAGLGLGLSLIIAIGAQNLFVLRQGVRREHVLAVALVCTASDAALIALGVSGIGLALHAVPWLMGVARLAGAAFLAGYAIMAAYRAVRPSGAAMQAGDDVACDTAACGRAAGDCAADDSVTTSAGLVTVSAQDVSAQDVSRQDVSRQEATGQEQVRVEAAGDHTTRTGSAQAPRRTATHVTRSGRGLAAVLATCLALTWLNPHVYLDTVFLLGSVASTHGDGRWWFAAGAMTASALWFFALGYGSRFLGRFLASPRAWRVVDGAIAAVMLAMAVSLALGA